MVPIQALCGNASQTRKGGERTCLTGHGRLELLLKLLDAHQGGGHLANRIPFNGLFRARRQGQQMRRILRTRIKRTHYIKTGEWRKKERRKGWCNLSVGAGFRAAARKSVLSRLDCCPLMHCTASELLRFPKTHGRICLRVL